MKSSNDKTNTNIALVLVVMVCIIVITYGLKMIKQYDNNLQSTELTNFKQHIIDSVRNSMYEPIEDNGNITASIDTLKH